MNKVYLNNGKGIFKKQKGKNIRVSEDAWSKIRKFCFDKNFNMGEFTGDAALAAIKNHKKINK